MSQSVMWEARVPSHARWLGPQSIGVGGTDLEKRHDDHEVTKLRLLIVKNNKTVNRPHCTVRSARVAAWLNPGRRVVGLDLGHAAPKVLPLVSTASAQVVLLHLDLLRSKTLADLVDLAFAGLLDQLGLLLHQEDARARPLYIS